jgi:hypothetical protein
VSISSLVSLIDRQKVAENMKIIQTEVTSLFEFVGRIYKKNNIQGIFVIIVILFSLLGGYLLGSKLSNTYLIPNLTQSQTSSKQTIKSPEPKYIPSNGVGQEAPAAPQIKNDGKKIIRDWIDIFKNIFNSFDPIFKDFLNLTPQYITQNSADIQFTTGTVKSPKPVFDIFMGISTSLIVLFLTLESIKVIAGSAGSLKEVGKKYLIGFILLFISGWIISISIDLANIFTQDVVGLSGTNGQSILSEFTIKYLDNLKLQYQDTNTDLIGIITGANNSNPLEILQAYFQMLIILFPSLIILGLFLLVTLQMAWRWAMLYLLAPFAPLAQVFYLAPFKNEITKNFWGTWTTNLIHLPIFLVCYKIFHEGFLANQTTTSNSQILIFIVFLFILWQINTHIGRIFGEIGVIMSNSFSTNVLTGASLAAGWWGTKNGTKLTIGGVKNLGKGVIGLAKLGGSGLNPVSRKAGNKPKTQASGFANKVNNISNVASSKKETKLLNKALKSNKKSTI